MAACSRDRVPEEQISVSEQEPVPFNPEDTLNSVKNNLSLSAISTYPQKVVLTGLSQHRLISIYKQIPKEEKDNGRNWTSYYFDKDGWDTEEYQHYMPGLDLLFGYNLLNLAHYDMKSEQLDYLFSRPVLVKSLYFPSFIPDSVGEKPNRKPINRDYFLVSVYDEDTNNDTLINRHDLRRLYHFNASCDVKTQVIPPDYNVIRSQFDSGNDAMYIFARHDQNKNGRSDESEPLHVFWLSLKTPASAKKMY
ncbi:MAG TPA: hypothetical protein VFE50_24135 [Cyclobacteriaceae bacterium]|nr:hypothetical protein [Cyclobacteriaceae bacterium]